MAGIRSYRLTIILTCFMMFSINSVNSAEFVPVFMWETSSNSHARKDVPALTTVSADEFKDIVVQKLHSKPAVVIFAEENLSVEDFSWQDEAGEGSFPNLENISSVTNGLTYLPFVHSPLRVFHHHSPLRGEDWRHLKLGPDSLSTDITSLNETLLLVNLDDATSNEDRPGLLKRHDALISQVFQTLAERHGHLLAIYTAHHSSWQSGEESLTRRVRRLLQTMDPEVTKEPGQYSSNTTLLYVSNMTLYDLRGKSYVLPAPENIFGEEGELTLEFATSKDITLKFMFEEVFSGYWTLSKINVTIGSEDFELKPRSIEAPLKFSYHCSQEVVIKGRDKSRLVVDKIQIQPYVQEGARTFGDAYDCIYFFTVPIWSGLFVCTLFSLIMTFGLCMIMDIKTMDRFDDPKGKTITINVAE